MTRGELRRITKIGNTKIRELEREGALRAVRFGRSVRYRREEVARLLDAHQQSA
jgi:excisionase family DNA binding protein